MDRFNKYQTKQYMHAHTFTLHTQNMVASTWLGDHQGRPYAPTNSLQKLLARYQVLLTITITIHETLLTNWHWSNSIKQLHWDGVYAKRHLADTSRTTAINDYLRTNKSFFTAQVQIELCNFIYININIVQSWLTPTRWSTLVETESSVWCSNWRNL